MLSEQEIVLLAAELESHRVERKESFKAAKGAIEEAICAFANDLPGTGQPGILLIGVQDKTGQPTGSPSPTSSFWTSRTSAATGTSCRSR